MKKQIEYTINKKEAEVIHNCLMYARHRIIKHEKYYKPHLKQIKKLIKELEDENKLPKT